MQKFTYFFMGLLVAGIVGYYNYPTPDLHDDEIAEAEPESAHVHTHDHDHEHEESIVKLSAEQIKELGLKFVDVKPGELHLTLSTRGKIVLQPDHLAHIIPKASGIAQDAFQNIGNEVKVNDLMAVLESRDIVDIKAAYLASLSKLKLAASSLQREEKLFNEKVSAGQDFLNAKSVFESAEIDVQLADQKLRAFGLTQEEIKNLDTAEAPDLRLYEIRSPLEGTVIMRHITKGEFVENTTTIYEIADLNTVWVELGIYPKDLYKVKQGQVIEVISPLGTESSLAKLFYVSPIVEDETITAKAVAELDNRDRKWKPGFFVKVNIQTDNVTLPMVIPKEAIQTSEGKDFVFLVTPEGFEQKFIKIGQSDSTQSQVVSGLSEGDKIVANKTFLLKAELGKSSAAHEH